MPGRHVAVVMPAYNEAEGIQEFLEEIVERVSPVCAELSLVVVNDRSTDGTAELLKTLSDTMPSVSTITSVRNQGHGPTALAAYRAGLELEADTVVHVDGDGQFLGSDIARVIAGHMANDVDVVHGVRGGRTDPWFRRVLTGCVRFVVSNVVGARVPDVNTPLRVYSPAALRRLMSVVPADSRVPHVHFSIAEKRSGMRVAYARVTNRPRRGHSAHGTMWGTTARIPLLPPKRLRSFVRASAREVWQISVRPGAPARELEPFRP